MITIPAFENGSPIPEQYAYCKMDPAHHMAPSNNKNPQIIWSHLPDGSKSLVLMCVDDKVPSVFTDVNKEGFSISKNLSRIDFYHWVLIDINPSLGEIKEGEDSDGVTEGGKAPGLKPYGMTGINSYSNGNNYGGYDGPCPPWNDEMMHQYHFRLYALNVSTLNLSGNFTGPDVLKAMEGHILAKAEWTGTYTLNPSLRKKS